MACNKINSASLGLAIRLGIAKSLPGLLSNLSESLFSIEPSTAPVRPEKGYHHEELRGALIHTALRMVTEEGTWDFALREVARRLA